MLTGEVSMRARTVLCLTGGWFTSIDDAAMRDYDGEARSGVIWAGRAGRRGKVKTEEMLVRDMKLV